MAIYARLGEDLPDEEAAILIADTELQCLDCGETINIGTNYLLFELSNVTVCMGCGNDFYKQ